MPKINLVLAGGGIRFSAYIGALYALKENNIEVEKLVGISGGSIISSLYASGHSIGDLKKLMLDMDYMQFKDFSPLALLKGMGLYKGKRFEKWIDKELGGKIFSDTFKIDHYIIATDILRGRPVIFSRHTFPHMKVSKAVRCSIGIPLFYAYEKLPISSTEHGIMIDGNISSIAIENMFQSDKHSTLTLRLTTSKTEFGTMHKSFNKFTYMHSLVRLMMNSIDKERIAGDRWRNTILIFTGDIHPTKFNLSRDEKLFLFEQGYRQVKANIGKAILASNS